MNPNINLEALPTDTLFTMLVEALGAGLYGDSLRLADEICRSSRAGTCPDLLPTVFPAFKGYSVEQLQPIKDRIDQYNVYVK